MERLLERDVAKPPVVAQSSTGRKNQDIAIPDEEEDDLPGHEDERELEPTPLAVQVRAFH